MDNGPRSRMEDNIQHIFGEVMAEIPDNDTAVADISLDEDIDSTMIWGHYADGFFINSVDVEQADCSEENANAAVVEVDTHVASPVDVVSPTNSIETAISPGDDANITSSVEGEHSCTDDASFDWTPSQKLKSEDGKPQNETHPHGNHKTVLDDMLDCKDGKHGTFPAVLQTGLDQCSVCAGSAPKSLAHKSVDCSKSPQATASGGKKLPPKLKLAAPTASKNQQKAKLPAPGASKCLVVRIPKKSISAKCQKSTLPKRKSCKRQVRRNKENTPPLKKCKTKRRGGAKAPKKRRAISEASKLAKASKKCRHAKADAPPLAEQRKRSGVAAPTTRK